MESVLMTGANSGLGRLTAETLAGQGYAVAAGIRESAGRGGEAARALAARARQGGRRLEVVELEVTDDASVRRAVGRAIEIAGGLAVVVNNAGSGAMGLTECYTAEQIRAVFQTHVLGATRVARAAPPHMRERRRGLLVAISSTLAQLALSSSGFYTASKRALQALAGAYRYEAGPFGVDSVILEAGALLTPAPAKHLLPADAACAATSGALVDLPGKLFGGLGERLRRSGAPDPQIIAVAAAVAALIRRPHGTRPIRTVVDVAMGAGIDAINAVTAGVQAQLLADLGMPDPGAAPAPAAAAGARS